MKTKPTDAQFLTALRRLQTQGRASVKAGELARIMRTNSVTALGAMERLKGKLKRAKPEAS